MEWRVDMQEDWNMAPVQQIQPWSLSAHIDEHTGEPRFSKEHSDNIRTFKLNADVGNQRYFTEQVDYSSFRDRSVVPTQEDILEEPEETTYQDEPQRYGQVPNVPINRVRGPYDSPEQYLYTQFELMRNDALIPLRNAVRSYRESCHPVEEVDFFADNMGTPRAPATSQSFRLFRKYEHVRLNALVFGTRHVLYRISFRLPHEENNVKWPSSKRLIEGTLVMLSKDDFQTDIKIATVVERGEIPMRGSNRFEYMIDIKLERDNERLPLGYGDPLIRDQEKYTMIEAVDGYFEAYRHILSVIQRTQPSDLPFSPQLVDVSPDVRLPHYAAMKRNYDIAEYRDGRCQGQSKPIDITSPWPVYNIGMDKTQMDALKTILSNNVSIVQGPPGTGKTFVGTYAMNVLLNNFPGSIGPIVCICQTNHALDQFLEHILKFNDQIVRVGGRSKSEELKEYLLYELRKQGEGAKGVSRLYRKRDELEKKIRDTIIQLYEEPCVTLEYIRSVKGLSPRQLDSIKRLGEREAKQVEKANIASEEYAWFSSPAPASVPATSLPPRKQQQKKKRGDNRAGSKDEWSSGNPNLEEDTEDKLNPVEVWLKDAIEYINSNGSLYTAADELRDKLLEQEQGLFFEEDEQDDLIDEDELQEITLNFEEPPDLRGNRQKSFINIGYAYKKKQSQGNRQLSFYEQMMADGRKDIGNERKVINYNKINPARKPVALEIDDEFNFFDDLIDQPSPEPTHYVMERWMREEEDATLWPLPVRLEAHKRWAEQRNRDLSAVLRGLVAQYDAVSQDIRKVFVQKDAKICRENRVVGLTSTAAAKYHDLLVEIRPRIMVVEEAAEMLEAHIVSALTQSLQHLVLIGDHQQLRPSTAVHALAEAHYMNVSLFERLVMNNVPFTRLSHQRRMRPDIRMLIDPIYSDPPLQDHPDVYKYPPVLGVAQPVFFLSHNEAESNVADTASKCNEHEAKMAAKLSLYLLLQGYQPSDITIITMYAGQRGMIKRALRDERRADYDPAEIRVSSVDGYQGEENKIIILSLVRSNAAGQIGFLKVANRVCVSLSRAKHGMYILGNAGLLCEKSDLWNEIVSNLEDHTHDRIGPRLALQCQRHNVVTEVQWPVDFATIPEGGCTRTCGEQLSCGHYCELPCHPYSHDEVKCRQPCSRRVESCGHLCSRRCWESCAPCTVLVKHKLPCGHFVQEDCTRVRRAIANPAIIQCMICLRK
ncbi:P-loop containing nucleoside triphosphate hydrolase protein [Dichotomocladium elegans]|nr:P-loop containing nucleoside triphosphate hydrolase protein [Dichotomocladium elegans]